MLSIIMEQWHLNMGWEPVNINDHGSSVFPAQLARAILLMSTYIFEGPTTEQGHTLDSIKITEK